MERAASASTTGADTPSSRKETCDILFDSLRVRDLLTSKHPKEEREAHLTGPAGLPIRALKVAVAPDFADFSALLASRRPLARSPRTRSVPARRRTRARGRATSRRRPAQTRQRVPR